MFIEVLFIAKVWKQTEGPSTDKWIYKMSWTYRMDYYSALIRNEVLIHHNMDVPLKHCANWKRYSVIHLCEISFWKQNVERQKVDWLPGTWADCKGMGRTANGYGCFVGSGESDENDWNFWLYRWFFNSEHTKNHWIVILEWINAIWIMS